MICLFVVNTSWLVATTMVKVSIQYGSDWRSYHLLGNCYYTGKGVIQDCSMAVKYFQLAADQDYADAVTL